MRLSLNQITVHCLLKILFIEFGDEDAISLSHGVL
jgi:hypothetical protein